MMFMTFAYAQKTPRLFRMVVLFMSALPVLTAVASHGTGTANTAEEVVVWGEHKSSSQAGYTNPTSVILQEDMASINIATTEEIGRAHV